MTDKPADETPERPDRGFRPPVEWGEKRPGARSLYIGPEGVFRHENGKLETIVDAVDIFWAEVAHDPRKWNRFLTGYDYLLESAAEATREEVRRALGWLEGAIGLKDRKGAVAACRYLAAMPALLLAADYGRLTAIFNSRKVGMVWQVTPDLDVKPLPSGPIPKFGNEAGFGLIRAVPELYLKLAMLSPEMEMIVTRLAAEAVRYRVSLPSELVTLAKGTASEG
jgi:hypothetical protein